MSNNIKLGIFTFIGILAIIISIFSVGNFSLNRTYNIYVEFDNIAGLTKKAKVKMAGIDIGVLRQVSLDKGKAKLKLSINRKVLLYKNAYARIVSIGVIGTKYIELVSGDENQPLLKNGDSILGQDSSSLESFLTSVSTQVNKALNNDKYGNMMENLADAIFSLRDILNTLAAQNGKIEDTFTNLDQFAKDLANISSQNKLNLNETLEQIKDISKKLDVLINRIYDGGGPIATLINDEKMGKDLKETVESAKEAIKSLNKTIAKSTKLSLDWKYTGRYNTRDSKLRNDIGISIMPNNEKFYYVGVANVTDADSVIDVNEKNNINKLEALLGFRREYSEIFGGVIRGKAGMGFGYSFFSPIYDVYKGLKFNLKVYDFARDSHGPQIDVGARYGIMKWLHTGILLEDISYKPSFTPYLRLEIDDQDLAAMLGIVTVAIVASK
ncbi:MAG: MlaD family protein [Endomicrobium sp.]|jgi:phospholipid/cholesterol/gamma-HCH transport system substrate-binding protein|uniref:MlaD family protein n=1 Tax=Candidatus Endomicrobiellum cubanum TaxID=3242325 RepID=UPI002819E003|nr:MlaD family protein [Endomicrobium sp.]